MEETVENAGEGHRSLTGADMGNDFGGILSACTCDAVYGRWPVMASWICLSVTVGGTYGRASLFHASCQRHRCSNGDGGGEGGGEGHWPDPSGTRRVAAGARRRPRRVRTGGRGACAERRCSPVVVLGAVLEHGVDGWGSEDADRIGEKGEKRCGVAAIAEGQEACKGRRVDLASRPVVHPP